MVSFYLYFIFILSIYYSHFSIDIGKLIYYLLDVLKRKSKMTTNIQKNKLFYYHASDRVYDSTFNTIEELILLEIKNE